MQKCKLAVDIGASSGCVIAGYMNDERLQLDEVHRFHNRMIEQNGHLCWDVDTLFFEIKKGIKKSLQQGYQPTTIGIDTWAVDFVLLDQHKERLTDAVAYRDHRTDGKMEEVFQTISKHDIYKETGIQFQPFNTIYQLYALKQESPEVLDAAQYFLMIPDYLHYLFTGRLSNEYTNATTTQLLKADTKNWSEELLQAIDIDPKLFQKPMQPGQVLGELTDELQEELDCQLQVVLPGTHDTASAVMAVPRQDTIYISSGTWSLMGVELDQPMSTPKAYDYNFTNEGGVNGSIRFLKNIMGLWMIQGVKREWNHVYSYTDFVNLAYQEENFHAIVDVNDKRFLRPHRMTEAIQTYCQETNQSVPTTAGELAKCIFDSLVESYHKVAEQIEELTGKTYDSIHIIGGGSKNHYMNEKLAMKTNKSIFTGPTEATALGNLLAQFSATGELSSVQASKQLIQQSFPIDTFS
ncbi:rhamnulokinase [Gracilibacillus halophilus YIM-C55.5]|uniref:Rhamnulokinase n=1 Tax=Gracilibacillus halophilus YIM-C55.5 TaxID=1308866 RepID=N4WLH6_9BACI|nr:rhamnulokinase [Gracilibacillus halophilus]ENH97012.1 rhamnulokinase [Gracilibacillus halophilus YIM-C55.5]